MGYSFFWPIGLHRGEDQSYTIEQEYLSGLSHGAPGSHNHMDCYPGSKCCHNECLPWFWRTLLQETTDDVEVPWCTSHAIGYDKVSTELLEVFVH